MVEERTSRSGNASTIAMILLVFVLLFPILYVLSLGPVVWFVNHTQSGGQIAQVIYFPLEWLHRQGGWPGQMLDWYVNLFR